MKEFKVRSGNFLKSSNSTSNMMYTILVVLIPFIIISNDKSKLSLIDTGLPKALLFTSKENPSKKLRSVLMI